MSLSESSRSFVNAIAATDARLYPRKSFWKDLMINCPLRKPLQGFIVVLAVFFISGASVYANNVAVSNAELVEKDADANTINIEFDISWSNAWKDSVNNDAVWTFFKYSTDSGTTWGHASLKTAGTNPTGFLTGTYSSGAFARLDLIVPTDKQGCFIQPRNVGTGTVNFTDLQAVWDYGQDGISDVTADAAATQVKVFAIEMVLVPAGGFQAGDGNTGSNGEFEYGGGNSSAPGAINAESGMSFGSVAGTWYYNSDGGANDAANGAEFQVSSSFPVGYQADYVMKYEISQGQYRDFLNTLTRAQQSKRVAATVTSDSVTNYYVMSNGTTVASRQGVRAPASGNGTTNPIVFGCDFDADGTFNESTDGEWIAMNYLSWMDLAAYADWSGLRPMSEVEFEKMARGPLAPVISEYAWGSTDLTDGDTISNSGLTSEAVTETGNGLANYQNDGVSGPLRVGFAATASTNTRKTAGAGYWGILDLSGNVWERAVTVGNAAGRGFSATHGDGDLTAVSGYEGNATNADWPGIDANESYGITGATGSGFRGGAWITTTTGQLTISNRTSAGTTDATRRSDSGGRLVRTAPQ